MKGFGIYVKNDLLEPKHVKQMGEAVWLYMWLLDKMTSVNENGEGKVLGNKPIVYEEIVKDLGFSKNTYTRHIDRLRNHDYISTLRTPRGIVFIVKKAKKGITRKSDSPSVVIPNKRGSDSPQMRNAEDSPNSGIQYKTKQSRLNKTKQIATTETKVSNDLVSQKYYQVIKQYSLPARNHANVKAAIKKLVAEATEHEAIVYLDFLIDRYQHLAFDHKPELNEALDIYAKRMQIINAVKRVANKQTAPSKGFKLS